MPDFRHEALLYDDEDEFLSGTVPFISDGLDSGEGVLVALDEAKNERLSDELGADARSVRFVDMHGLGENPARIIPVWREFVAANVQEGQGMRGIGEPIWPGRDPEELIECHRHEWLLNLAFDDGPPWALLCPYDSANLDDAVLDAALHNHPLVTGGADAQTSDSYDGPNGGSGTPFDEPLPEPGGDPAGLEFGDDTLAEVRRFVGDQARRAELAPGRAADLAVAANELASNSVRHAGGNGVVRCWHEPDKLLCEVHDAGPPIHPLEGRRRADAEETSGRGLWIVNQLCDLVQIRSLPQGNVARVQMRTSSA